MAVKFQAGGASETLPPRPRRLGRAAAADELPEATAAEEEAAVAGVALLFPPSDCGFAGLADEAPAPPLPPLPVLAPKLEWAAGVLVLPLGPSANDNAPPS